MKIMSFNTQHCLNYIEQKIDFQIMADAIKKCDADIVGLNEMRNLGTEEGFTNQVKTLSELTGMEHHYFAKALEVRGKNPYGNGFLSKLTILSAETIMIPDPEKKLEVQMDETGTIPRHYETRCLLKAKLEGGITVLVTHFGLNPDEQRNAVDTVIKNLADEKCILMGDFNMRPDNEILNPIRERMKDASDVFSEPLCSFPSDNPRCKIDYIFVSPDVEIVSADIPAIVASDHRPHTATINFK